MNSHWLDVGLLSEVPQRGGRAMRIGSRDIGLFRTAEDEIFALENHCPHRKGPLSEGIVHGRFVTCPLHNWVISLETGEAQGADHGCTPSIPIKVEGGRIYMNVAGLFAKAG